MILASDTDSMQTIGWQSTSVCARSVHGIKKITLVFSGPVYRTGTTLVDVCSMHGKKNHIGPFWPRVSNGRAQQYLMIKRQFNFFLVPYSMHVSIIHILCTKRHICGNAPEAYNNFSSIFTSPPHISLINNKKKFQKIRKEALKTFEGKTHLLSI